MSEYYPVLTILYPPEQRRSFLIREGRSVIGRGLEADICINDELVSRTHCEIFRCGTALRIRDLGSTNGTFLNFTAISESQLQDGEKLQLGATILKIEFKTENGIASTDLKNLETPTSSENQSDESPKDSPKTFAQMPALQTSLEANHSPENEIPLRAVLPYADFLSYAKNIASFGEKNKISSAILYLKILIEPKPSSLNFIIQKLVHSIVKEKRTFDLIGSLGELEYVLFLSNASLEEADELKQKISSALSAHVFMWNEQKLTLNVCTKILPIAKVTEESLHDVLKQMSNDVP